MRKKLVNEKRDELKQLTPRELVDRILEFPDATVLNYDEEGNRRKFPVEEMARGFQAKDYAMSEKQFYTLVHHFAAATVPEMKVVGITFRDSDPSSFVKDEIGKTDKKTTYEMDFHLVPEPTNPVDPNAIAVYVEQTDGQEHQIGYLNKEFAAKYPMTEDMMTKGYLSDWSNGKFKVISYSLAVDVEENQLTHQQMPEEKLYVYTTQFNYYNTDTENDFINQNTDTMTERFKEFNQNPALKRDIADVTWTCDGDEFNVVTVVAHRELTDRELQSDLTQFLQAHLEDYGWFQWNVQEYSLDDTLDMDENQDTTKVYGTHFSLTGTVNDVEAAKEYLTEPPMTKFLTEALPEIKDKVANIEWILNDNGYEGDILLVANEPLDDYELYKISNWIEGQNSDGIGESFEQQQFAYTTWDDWDDEDDEFVDLGDGEMISFDWVSNTYRLSDVTERYADYAHMTMEKQNPYSLGDGDLDEITESAEETL